MGMAKYDRLLYILNLLRSRRTLNAQRLAEKCQVTERSIYRDLISLSEANVPIYYDNGYKLASENFLPPLNFTFDEYTCLKLALDSSPLARTGGKENLLKQIRAKVDSGLSEATRSQKRTAVDIAHIKIDTTSPRKIPTSYYGALERAIADRTCMRIEYETIEHGLTRRTVDPYFIVFRRHAFYFVAFCHLRDAFRTFRIDRIRSLRATGQAFRRRSGISARDYFADSWQLYRGDPVEFKIRFRGRAARVVLSGCHHPREKIEHLEGNEILYRVKVRGTEEILRWLLGFGVEAELLEPVALRRELVRIGRAMARTYKSN
jgi:predicted DNA-binding transcriptional regulator YafY